MAHGRCWGRFSGQGEHTGKGILLEDEARRSQGSGGWLRRLLRHPGRHFFPSRGRQPSRLASVAQAPARPPADLSILVSVAGTEGSGRPAPRKASTAPGATTGCPCRTRNRIPGPETPERRPGPGNASSCCGDSSMTWKGVGQNARVSTVTSPLVWTEAWHRGRDEHTQTTLPKRRCRHPMFFYIRTGVSQMITFRVPHRKNACNYRLSTHRCRKRERRNQSCTPGRHALSGCPSGTCSFQLHASRDGMLTLGGAVTSLLD